ncbi:hypothetical protein [Sulfuriferula sp.]|uniref:hypothetical protein n=1 Tax=Sulfuriferula sp. TaxID=2025307 RepID=UPI00272F5C1F|nr:hypothetical protein [Sulfuriferula sp.]MDP2026415.1 hypothetical protein [Sulfuriferula sp.]
MKTLPEIQQAWHARIQRKPARPSCYDHAEFIGGWLPGCPHWRAGGNAHLMRQLHDQRGVRLPWTACSGCKHKVSTEN